LDLIEGTPFRLAPSLSASGFIRVLLQKIPLEEIGLKKIYGWLNGMEMQPPYGVADLASQTAICDPFETLAKTPKTKH